MAMQDAIHQNAGLRETFSRSVARAPPEIKIISHSNIFYWWPAWVAGFAVALISYTQGRDVAIVPEIIDRVHPSNNPGIFFIAVLVSLIVFTTTKLRGIYSVVTVVTVAFFVVLFAWFGWWDNILRFIPHISARANMGFYLLFSGSLLAVWLLAFFVFDRLTIWRVRPGQMIEERLSRRPSTQLRHQWPCFREARPGPIPRHHSWNGCGRPDYQDRRREQRDATNPQCAVGGSQDEGNRKVDRRKARRGSHQQGLDHGNTWRRKRDLKYC